MLHFSRGISFSVNIGNFLQLERAFEGNRIVDAPAEKQKILRAHILLGKIFAVFLVRQQMLKFARNSRQFLDGVSGLVAG